MQNLGLKCHLGKIRSKTEILSSHNHFCQKIELTGTEQWASSNALQ